MTSLLARYRYQGRHRVLTATFLEALYVWFWYVRHPLGGARTGRAEDRTDAELAAAGNGGQS